MRSALLRALLVCLVVSGFLAQHAAGVRAASSGLVISQVYGGGGNSGATYTHDFIELFNAGSTPVHLAGMSVQYASAAGTSWAVTPLTDVTLQPGQYYLVQEAQGSGGTMSLPAADATGSIALSATSGKVALVATTAPLSGACPAAIDFVGFGSSASCFESTPAPTLSNTTAAIRAAAGCTDTDNNSADFSTGAPAPRNSAAPLHACTAPTAPTALAAASPATVAAGGTTTLEVTVTPGTNPTSTGITVAGDLSSIGGSNLQPFTANGNTFTFAATLDAATTPGVKTIPISVSDAQGRSATASISLIVPTLSSSTIVISQVYGGGGNSGATYQNDYVQLYNRGADPVDVTGWSVQYASAAGGNWDNRVPLGGVIPPRAYYLVAMASGGATGAALPAANVSGDVNMSASAGKVALVDNGYPMSGTCPLTDPAYVNAIRDFVGYGSTASCREGGATSASNAPGASNTTALLRAGDGAIDSDDNSSDFSAGAPAPSTTAPITEIGPFLLSTDPRFDGTNAPHDATIEVSFSEPVDVQPGWIDITCATSGTHDDATSAANGRDRYVTPNLNFAYGERCTATVHAQLVSDADLDDALPNTDHLPSDYTWSFTVVAAGDPPPYPSDVHLTMGNPSGAVSDLASPNNYLMTKTEYALSYNRALGRPNWVSWHLTPEWYGSLSRFDTFRPDPALPSDWYRVQSFDFMFSGFDRGHMVPNADRDNQNRIAGNQATYLMSNMVAQAPDNNQGPWVNLENYLRTLTDAGKELYIVAGPAGIGGTGSNGYAEWLADGHVAVPAATWKAALVLDKAGGDDVSRVTCSTRTIAVVMPNTQGIRTSDPNDWQQQPYLTTVDAIESMTGLDLFSNVPTAIQNCVEAGVNGINPQAQTITFEPIAAQELGAVLSLTPTASSHLPVAISVVSGPAVVVNGLVHLTGTGTVTIRATQAGNVLTAAEDVPVTARFAAAPAVDRSFAVVDTTAPSMSQVAATPDHVTVPNHKMFDVFVDYTATDLGGAPVCTLQVTSNEPVNGSGDGNTATDWLVVDAHHVQLRAERSGHGSGRVYTITATCVDAAGNAASRTATVSVRK